MEARPGGHELVLTAGARAAPRALAAHRAPRCSHAAQGTRWGGARGTSKPLCPRKPSPPPVASRSVHGTLSSPLALGRGAAGAGGGEGHCGPSLRHLSRPARRSCTQTSRHSRPRPRRPPTCLPPPFPILHSHPRPRPPPTCLLPLDGPLVSVPQNRYCGVRGALGPPPPRRVSTGPRTLAHGCYFALLGFCAPAASPRFPARRGGPSITRSRPSSSLRGFQGAGAVSTCALSSSPVEMVPGRRAPGPGWALRVPPHEAVPLWPFSPGAAGFPGAPRHLLWCCFLSTLSR